MRMTIAGLTIAKLASTLILLSFLFIIYWTLHEYDYGHALLKLACFSTLFAAIVGFQFVQARADIPRAAHFAEIVVLVIVLQATFLLQFGTYAKNIFDPPVSDIGYTTVHAAKVLVVEGENPYSRTDINRDRKDMNPGFRGFHYGPVMIAGYLPTAFLPGYSYKLISILYVLVSVLLLVLLVIKPQESELEHVANAMFVLAAYFIAKRFWLEVLFEGANDVFHIMLILAALYGLKKGRIFLAGLFTGLSMAAKFAPGAFLVPFMPVRERNFWLGLGVGLTPYLPFLIWDPAGLWRNVFWLRVVIPADHTSLYWITPRSFQWVLGAVMLSACLIAVWWAVRRKLEFEAVVVGFTLLLIVVDVTQKQIHGNHLIWFYPIVALLFMKYRDKLYSLMVGRRQQAAD